MLTRPAPLRRLLGALARFGAAKGGNVATIFAVTSVPMLALTGAAIDYGLSTRQQANLQASADATTLALCQTPNITSHDDLQNQAKSYMTGYVPDSTMAVDPLDIADATQTTARTIKLTAHVESGTFFSGFTGVAKPQVYGVSKCATPIPTTFEIALVLDNTGSMNESSGSQSKIQALRVAANKFVDYVSTNKAFSPQTRMSVVPFAAAVAVDPVASAKATWVDTQGRSSYHWTNIDKATANAKGFASRLQIFDALSKSSPSNPNWAWAGCFETPPYPQNVKDGAPSSGTTQADWDTLYVPMLAPDEPGRGDDNYTCWNSNGYSYCGANPTALFNSYIDDTGDTSVCKSDGTFFNAEKLACKYAARNNAQPTSSNSATGVPNGPNYQCVSKPLQRLTTNSATLKTLISSLTAAGQTNIHDGLMWGWRTLSPNSVFADGALYTAQDTTKVLILMTDGTNTWPGNGYNGYNKSMYFPFGYVVNADGSTPASRLPPSTQDVSTASAQRAALDQLTREACANVKSSGISVWTIGFSVPQDPIDSQGLALLKGCASNSAQAIVANDSNDIIAAFDKIAKSIGALRISQ